MSRALRQALRLLHINRVLVRHGLDDVVLTLRIFQPVNFLRFLLPWNWRRRFEQPRAVRLRRALEDLGPVFVKFGQMLSTRQDLLPLDMAQELASLQDRVPAFPSVVARAIIERELGDSIQSTFRSFDDKPLASASIAQVHAATLHDGRSVVVKVVRPDIARTIRGDIDLLYAIADLAERYWREGRRLHVREVVAEFEHILFDELDLMREASSASLLRRNFEGSELLYVPEVIWPLTRSKVMVMERISGIPIGEVDRLRELGVDMRVLAERGVEIFFTQVVKHNFFHADMHPGNIFVDAVNPRLPGYIAVDFGIMGSLTPEDKSYLAENFIAFFNRDYRRVAELHLMSRWVPAETRVNELEAAIRSVCEPVFERPLSEISFGNLLLRLFQTARRFDIEVQPQLVLLQKTLLNIEGLGRQLYPELDLWRTAKPFLEQWVRERVGGRAILRELKQQAPRWAETLPRLPVLLHDVLKQSSEGQLQMRLTSEDLTEIRREIRRANRRTVQSVVGAALVISAAAVYGLSGYQPHMVWGAPLMSWVLGGLGLYLIVSGAGD